MGSKKGSNDTPSCAAAIFMQSSASACGSLCATRMERSAAYKQSESSRACEYGTVPYL